MVRRQPYHRDTGCKQYRHLRFRIYTAEAYTPGQHMGRRHCWGHPTTHGLVRRRKPVQHNEHLLHESIIHLGRVTGIVVHPTSDRRLAPRRSTICVAIPAFLCALSRRTIRVRWSRLPHAHIDQHPHGCACFATLQSGHVPHLRGLELLRRHRFQFPAHEQRNQCLDVERGGTFLAAEW